MSNPKAIRAVTQAVYELIKQGVNRQRQLFNVPDGGVDVRTDPPNRIQPAATPVVNLYLYRVAPNPAFRNTDANARGRAAGPVLPVNLSYLVSVVGNGQGFDEHDLLGWVMSVLHDNPVLQQAKPIQSFIQQAQASGDLDQAEQVKLTPAPLSVEDLAKLWSGFQTNYRLSVGYEASVVLIDSARGDAPALPVLSRGMVPPEGFEVDPGLTFPTLTVADFPYPQPAPGGGAAAPVRTLPFGRVEDVLRVAGTRLGKPADRLTLVFRHPRLPKPRTVPPNGDVIDRSADHAMVRFRQLPKDDPPPQLAADGTIPDSIWPAGTYTVAAEVTPPFVIPAAPPPAYTSNEVAFTLVPYIAVKTLQSAPNHLVTVLAVEVIPPILPGQRVSVFVGTYEVPAGPIKKVTSRVVLRLSGDGQLDPKPYEHVISPGATAIPPGQYFVRLRVDGADSMLFDPDDAELVFNKIKYQVSLPPSVGPNP